MSIGLDCWQINDGRFNVTPDRQREDDGGGLGKELDSAICTMKTTPQYRLVRIEWLDSHYVAGWHTTEPATDSLHCHSVGWLVYDGENAKTIAAHMTDEDTPQRGGEMTIPVSAIVKVRTLR